MMKRMNKESSLEEQQLTTRNSKRHRTKTNRYEIDFLENDEQKHIQQAMRNSLIETRRIDIPTPSAPTYYPTVEEFHDVLKYISKIRMEAEQYGICKIVPPKGWNPVCQINLSESNPKVFPTKLQDISRLQQGEGFEDGKYYTFANYRKMADQFTTDWSNKYYEGKKIPEEVSYDELAKDYWDIVETHTKQAIVEYGNDLDTDIFMSGFPTVNSTNNSTTTIPHQFQNHQHHYHDGAASSSTSNTIEISVSPVASNTIGTKGVQNDSNTIFDEDYYIKSGWNLTQLPTCSGSVLQHITTPINGVNVPWLYVGMLFSSFCWHNEDNYLFSMNYSHYGAPKQWYGVPASDTKRFEKVSKDFLLESFQESPDLLQHMTTQISPSLLQANGVKVYKTLQEAQTFIITFPKAFHCGFNHGFNINEAVNFATPDWLSLGAEAEEKYRLIARGSVFSHQRLLFTLLHHLTQQRDDEYTKQIKLTDIHPNKNTVHVPTDINTNNNTNIPYNTSNINTSNTTNTHTTVTTTTTTTTTTTSTTITAAACQDKNTNQQATLIRNNSKEGGDKGMPVSSSTATTNNNCNSNNNNNNSNSNNSNSNNSSTNNNNTSTTVATPPPLQSLLVTQLPQTMSLEHQQSLANEIFKVVDEELVTRPVILAQGIKDISLQVKLPPNDFVALSKKALEYDDMRTCCICKHICVFSAIACECDRAKVTCIRHFSFMCKCTRDKKFLLKWASDDYMRDMKKQMLRIMRNRPAVNTTNSNNTSTSISNTSSNSTIISNTPLQTTHSEQQTLSSNTISSSSTSCSSSSNHTSSSSHNHTTNTTGVSL